MTPLESKLSELLDDCERLLELYVLTKQKWIIISETQKRLDTIFDEKLSLAISYGKARNKILELPSYKDAKTVFGRDSVFPEAVSTAGYWATFDGIIQYIISNAGSYKKGKVVIDSTKAIGMLRDLRKVLTQKTLKFVATARLMGVTLTSKSFKLPDGIVIRRLTRKERNDRQPTLEPYLSSGWEEQQLADHPSELSVFVTVPVDYKQDGAFFNTINDAQSVASQMFNKVVEAVLVATSGKAKLSAINLSGGIEHIPTGRVLSQEMPPHVNITLRKKDIPKIASAYDLVSGGRLSDKTLNRSLHRFLLGRKRADLVDKLVDYVIAWEALLLTSDGNPITQELSYRFSLNGAVLISSANIKTKPNEVYKKMKGAYSARSTIVHGGSEKEIEKTLKAGEYNNIQELCGYLELSYRNVVFWLLALKSKERPYLKQGGWELLIWSNH